MDFAQILSWISDAGVVVGALLSILGGLKVLARYTKSEADDKVLEAVERFLLAARDFVFKFKK